jgi:hypothetical protein
MAQVLQLLGKADRYGREKQNEFDHLFTNYHNDR